MSQVPEGLRPPYQVPSQGGFISAQRITAGAISAGEYVESDNYSAGSAGWHIDGEGNAEFNNVTVRGEVQATSGTLGDLSVTGDLSITNDGSITTDDGGGSTAAMHTGWFETTDTGDGMNTFKGYLTGTSLRFQKNAGDEVKLEWVDLGGPGGEVFRILTDIPVFVVGDLRHSTGGLGFFGTAPATQAANVSDPAGGATVDAEARTAINAIIDVLERFGLSAP